MTETVHADGTIRLYGSSREVKETLDAYFERGYMMVPGSGSDVHGGNITFCTVELPRDFSQRLAAREEWMKEFAQREADRQRLIYARKRVAA
jgi:hypothetical protein